ATVSAGAVGLLLITSASDPNCCGWTSAGPAPWPGGKAASREGRFDPRPDASTAIRAVRPNGNTPARGELPATSVNTLASRQPVGVELGQVPAEAPDGHSGVGRDLVAVSYAWCDLGCSQLAVFDGLHAAGQGSGVLASSETGDHLCLPLPVAGWHGRQVSVGIGHLPEVGEQHARRAGGPQLGEAGLCRLQVEFG